MDTCLNCNEKITQSEGRGRKKKFCSSSCQRKYQYKTKIKKSEHVTYLAICEECFDMFEAKNIKGRFCSTKCQRANHARENPRYTKICPICKSEFTTDIKSQALCSLKCNSFKANEPRRLAAIENQYKTIPRHIFPTNRARQSYLRRKRTREQWVEEVQVEVLIERDKGICQICQKPVRLDVHYTHPDAPTRDHIIPLSKGGEHSYANCQLACRDCNTIKNNRIEVNLLDKTEQKRKSSSSKVANKRRN